MAAKKRKRIIKKETEDEPEEPGEPVEGTGDAPEGEGPINDDGATLHQSMAPTCPL